MFSPNLCNSLKKLPCRYRVRPSRRREGEMDAPLESTLLYGKTTTNELKTDQLQW